MSLLEWCEIRHGLSDRLVTFSKTLDKNIEKFEAVARKATREKFSFTLCSTRRVSFGINSTTPIKSIVASKLQRNCCLSNSFSSWKFFLLLVIAEMKCQTQNCIDSSYNIFWIAFLTKQYWKLYVTENAQKCNCNMHFLLIYCRVINRSFEKFWHSKVFGI